MAWSGAGAGAAQAVTITVDPLVQGSGSVLVTQTGYRCDIIQASDQSTTNICGNAVLNSGAQIATMTLTAQPWPTPSGHWRFLRWEGCPPPPFGSVSGNQCSVTAIFNNLSVTVKAVFDDFVAPAINSVTPVYSTTTDRGVSFSVATNESTSAIECSVDNGPAQSCGLRVLGEGPHTVQARARDHSGNLSGFSAPVNFRVLDTALVNGPPDFHSSKRPTFRFSTQTGFTFRCRLDSQPEFDCGPKTNGQSSWTPTTDLSEGTHTFRVWAFDSASDFDRVPITRTWTVDTVAPNTTLSSPTLPEGVVTTLLEAEFAFGSTEPLGRLECKLDTAAFAACTSPKTFTDLAFGPHRFEVRAFDRAGNMDATPAVRNWEIAARDADGDGFNQRSDCDDSNAGINPARPEILDNDVDENCDGVKGINLDRDGDGVNRPSDCDDANAGINPNRPEILDNGVDENCDGADGINFDRDGDGATRPADCDDGNPNIRPGSADVPNNGIDEDCRDGDLRVAIEIDLARSFARFPARTALTRLQVKKVPSGSTVKVTCKFKKKKCPKKARKAFTKRNAAGTVGLKRFTRIKFKPGTTITVTVTKPGAIGAVKVLKIRRGKDPSVTDRCLPPGTKKPVAC